MTEVKEIRESGSANAEGVISLNSDTMKAILTQKESIKKLKGYISKFLTRSYSSEIDIY
jgi:hypothetical protein